MRVTSKGQVTVPKAVRDQTGIGPGSDVEFKIEEGKVILFKRPEGETEAQRRRREIRDYLDRVRGTLDPGMSADEYIELLRGD